MSALLRKLRLLVRDRAALALLAVALLAAAAAVTSGRIEVRQQRAQLTALIDADQRERDSPETKSRFHKQPIHDPLLHIW